MAEVKEKKQMNSKIGNECEKMLDSVKLRRTRPRLQILSTLLGCDSPLTQQQIAKSLANESPDKVTIYRVLQTLLEAGLVHKAFLDGRTWHFELADDCSEEQCHPHFMCTGCGVTHCMPGVDVPLVKTDGGFSVKHQQIRLEGLCPQCNQMGKT